ncbi:MAG: Nramp family divalent metal transporter [Spirochaetia bacterium]
MNFTAEFNTVSGRMRLENRSAQMHSSTMSARTAKAAGEVLEGRSRRGFFRRILPFLGPAFIASIAYIDPGNFATNIQSGAQYGYLLLWVIVASNVMASLVQVFAAKLGIATGKNLAEHCAEQFSKPMTFCLWIAMEVSAMASDLTGFIGATLGFNLLFGIPLWIAGLVTGAITLIILGLERFGFRSLEAVIAALVGIISISYVIEIAIVKPLWGDVLTYAIIPRLEGTQSIVLAAGILGATLTPYAIILHSALTQDRVVPHGDIQKKRLLRFEIVDVGVAMGIAGLVNVAMLVMAAGTFYQHGEKNVGTLEQAYKTLQPLLGQAATWSFAVSLLASGLSSATVVTQAGQIILKGFLDRRIPIWVRRFITMVPSFVIILTHLDPTRSLVISQVVLSFSLPLALVPLVIFTGRKDLMGNLVNKSATKALIVLITTVITALNAYLLFGLLKGR